MDMSAKGETPIALDNWIVTCRGMRTRVSGKGKKTVVHSETCGKKFSTLRPARGKGLKHVQCPFCHSQIEVKAAKAAGDLVLAKESE